MLGVVDLHELSLGTGSPAIVHHRQKLGSLLELQSMSLASPKILVRVEIFQNSKYRVPIFPPYIKIGPLEYVSKVGHSGFSQINGQPAKLHHPRLKHWNFGRVASEYMPGVIVAYIPQEKRVSHRDAFVQRPFHACYHGKCAFPNLALVLRVILCLGLWICEAIVYRIYNYDESYEIIVAYLRKYRGGPVGKI